MDSRQGQDSEMEDIAYSHDRILARFAGLLEPEKPTGLSPDTALMLDRLDFKLRSWRHNFDDAVALVSTTMEHQSAYSDQLARTTQSLKRIQDYLGVDDAHAILHPLEADAEIKTLVDIETHLRSIVSPPSPIHHDNSLAGCEECSSECDSEFDIAWRPQGHDDPVIMNLLLDMNKTDLAAELLRAAEHGLVNTMDALLSRLTVHDLESMRTKDRRTALHVAILNGHENIAQKLLSKAPNLERRLQQPFARDLLLRRPSVKQIDAMDRPCKNAQYEVSRLRVPMSAGAEYPGAHRCLFPADEIKKLFQRDFVLRIFECDCEDCTTDRSSFDGGHLDQWIQCADKVVKCATSLFALLAHLSRPMLIIGILHKTQDAALRSSSILTREWLETKCWPELFAENKESAKLLLGEFEGLKHNFLMEKIDGTSREYPGEVILPFARTEEVGKAQGNFGIVYKFEIPEYYREFELPEIFKTPYYRGKRLKFARKELRDISRKPFWLEEKNLTHINAILRHEPDHFVQMLKAYRHGTAYNIIFPCAEMNLDDFFRDPENQSYCKRPLRGNPLWEEMLGICRALKHMVEGQGPENGEKFFGYHFDLKPANILIFGEHTWQIADFGQSVFRAKTGSSMKLTNPGGTDEYAPPENADPEAKASAKYDVWSMGCILLELTAFLVMKEPPGIQALNEARHTKDDQGSDHRLWTKTPTNKMKLKSDIKKFIDDLPALVGSDPREVEFVGPILELTRRMLEPDVKERCSASEVVAALEGIVRKSTESSRNEQLSTDPVEPRPNAASPPLRIEDLSNRSYLHLGSPNGTPRRTHAEGEAPHSNIYQLELSESHGYVGLLIEQRANSERSRGIYKHHAQYILKRKEDLFVPLYAFGIVPSGLNHHLRFYISRLTDLQNANNNSSKFTGTSSLVKDELIFATSSHPRDELGLLELTDVLAAQTVFTMQEVVEYRSYRLEGFKATEHQGLTASITKGKKAVGNSFKEFGRAIRARSATETDSSRGVGSSRDTGSDPAEQSSRAVMVQIWREQKNEPQSRERAIRRRVVIFKQDGSMFVIRMMKEWREIESRSGSHSERQESPPGCVTFVPTKPAAMPTFDAATLVRRKPLDDGEQGLAVAGIPMHPGVLAHLEDQNQKSYTKVELTFGSEEGKSHHQVMVATYADVK